MDSGRAWARWYGGGTVHERAIPACLYEAFLTAPADRNSREALSRRPR